MRVWFYLGWRRCSDLFIFIFFPHKNPRLTCLGLWSAPHGTASTAQPCELPSTPCGACAPPRGHLSILSLPSSWGPISPAPASCQAWLCLHVPSSSLHPPRGEWSQGLSWPVGPVGPAGWSWQRCGVGAVGGSSSRGFRPPSSLIPQL